MYVFLVAKMATPHPAVDRNYCFEPSPTAAALSFAVLYIHVGSFNMAFRSRISPLSRSSLGAFRTSLARRTVSSQSRDSASYVRFAGPFILGASAATAGLLVGRKLYNNNFTLFGNVLAATKVGHLDANNV